MRINITSYAIQSPDHNLAKWRSASSHWQNWKKKPVYSKNRARPMAARLIKMYVDQVN